MKIYYIIIIITWLCENNQVMERRQEEKMKLNVLTGLNEPAVTNLN